MYVHTVLYNVHRAPTASSLQATASAAFYSQATRRLEAVAAFSAAELGPRQ